MREHSRLGLPLLQELDPPHAEPLWQLLRAVHVWSAVSLTEREGLFPEGSADRRMAEILAAGFSAEVEAILAPLVEMVRHPEGMDAEPVALACTRIGRWATNAGYPRTAGEWILAAAYASPGSAIYALAAAREYRDQGRFAEAEALYQRAVIYARQSRDWDTYTLAHAGIGMVAYHRGAYPAARRGLQKALQSAERRSLRLLRAKMLHQLFTLEGHCSRYEQAEAYAEEAAHAYAGDPTGLRRLSVDIAAMWIDRSRFSEAARVLGRIRERATGDEWVIGSGQLARALGGLGATAGVLSILRELESLPSETPRRLDGLMMATMGALAGGALDAAERVALMLQKEAGARGQHATVFEAERVVQQVTALRGEGTARRETVVATSPDSDFSFVLEQQLVACGA